MERNLELKVYQLEETLRNSKPLGTVAGFGLGVLTQLALGDQAYRTPGGAVGMGVTLALLSKNHKLADYLLNIANCEIGYYMGVIAAEQVVKLF